MAKLCRGTFFLTPIWKNFAKKKLMVQIVDPFFLLDIFWSYFWHQLIFFSHSSLIYSFITKSKKKIQKLNSPLCILLWLTQVQGRRERKWPKKMGVK
jgi:hypothetical protein